MTLPDTQISGLSGAHPDFGVYVHWPFCAAKCPYCDFNSHVHHGPLDQQALVEHYATEIAHFARLTPGRVVKTIFFGGGTPSLMDVSTVENILRAIAQNWSMSNDVEITLEANPTSVEAERFRGYRAAGVNRVSLGVQSLKDKDLKALGRMHTVDEALKAVELAQSIFDRSSFDLIYARPDMTLKSWEKELTRAISYTQGHMSLYQLTIEQGTRYFDLFHAGKLKLPSPDVCADLFDLTQDICAAHGMPSYEVSNHAIPGQESRHNLIYWRYGEYAGIGPGAHSRLIINGTRRAIEIERSPAQWNELVAKNGHGIIVNDPLTWEEEGDEYLLMGLRLKEGIDPLRFETLSHRALAQDQIVHLLDIGFIEILPTGYLRVTKDGWPVIDAVVADLAA